MTAPPPDERTIRRAAAGIVVLGSANFIAITTEILPVGLLPQLAGGVGVSESTAGLLVTIYAFVVAAAAVPLTVATRRLPRKPLLMGALATYAASNVLVATAPSFAMLAAGRILGGLAHAIFFSISIAYASRLVAPRFAGRALSLVTAGATLGFVLGVPFSTSLGIAVGWRWSFAVLAAGCAVSLLLVAALLPAVAVQRRRRRDHGDTRRGRTRLGIVVTTNGLLFGGQYTAYTYISVILLASGVSAGAIGPILLVFGALGLIGLWAAARFLDRSPRALTITVTATMAGAMVALALAIPAAAGVVVTAGVWLAAFGAIPSALQVAALRTAGGSADVAGALVNATANFGIGTGAALGAAVVAGAGFVAAVFTAAAIVGVGLTVVLLSRSAFPSRPEL
jgi:predicted MFS family arabinose efflux permease